MAYKEGEWFKQQGFNEKGLTYVYFPTDSYEVKEELKEAGFRFNKPMLWHAPEVPEGYEDKVVEVWFDAVGVMSAWHEGFYGEHAAKTVAERVAAKRPKKESHSEWVGQVKDKVTKKFTVVFTKGTHTMYGFTQLVKFEDEDGNNYTWWASAAWASELKKGQTVTLTATVKDHTEYMGEKTTVVTRCKRV